VIAMCPRCRLELGPWEASACLSCVSSDYPISDATIADLAVYVLEKERSPLTAYDVTRVILRDFGRELYEQSVSASLSADRRFCWGGRGIYGLFRHGLFPGPRSLAELSELVLYAYGQPLRVEFLAFALKDVGYRYQTQSLRNAIAKNSRIGWSQEDECFVVPTESARRRLRRLGVARNKATVELIIERCAKAIRQALRNYRRRLRLARPTIVFP
jgi:hypothetical protein